MKKAVYLLLLIFGCQYVIAEEVNSEILSSSALKSLGYKESKHLKYNGSQCDSYELDFPAIKKYQSIKAIQPTFKGGSLFFRFTLIKEQFESEDHAIKRLAQFEPPNSVKGDSYYSKTCSSKKGFRRGDTVYFVATDAFRFRDKLPDMRLTFKQQITQ